MENIESPLYVQFQAVDAEILERRDEVIRPVWTMERRWTATAMFVSRDN